MNRISGLAAGVALSAGLLSGCSGEIGSVPSTYPNLTEVPDPMDTIGLGSFPVTAPETSVVVSVDEALLSIPSCNALRELDDALGLLGEGVLRMGTGDQTSYVEPIVDPNRVSLDASAVMDALAEGTNTIPVPSDPEGAYAVHSAVGAVSTAELTVDPIDEVYRIVFDNGVENAGADYDEANAIAVGMLDQARLATDEAIQVGC